ncbi:MAG: helix-turn-helix domain-containing protein [Tannerellaceae bacterium]|jgi:ligand-binding sensor domain-containing protein/AraC-like DNA-binding protein|nr:helix-turn-helix domain-containing protein [Tannerellaceae bacterium]
MNINRLVPLTVFTICIRFTALGQDIYYQSLGNKDGLSQASAVSFWQDPAGRIWIGNDALNCFDGEEVRVFRVSEYLPGVEDSNIHALCGGDSLLFFLAENALFSFDLVHETFHNLQIPTYSVCYSDAGLYYLSAGKALSVYDPDTGASRPLLSLPDSVRYATAIVSPEEGVCWVGTPSGIYVADIKEGRVEVLLPGEHIVCLYKDSGGCIWIATQKYQLYLFPPDRALTPLRINREGTAQSVQIPNHILCIQEDVEKTVWIGTLTGAYRLQKKEQDAFEWKQYIWKESMISALFSDRQGTMWIGSYYGDVRYHHPVMDNYTFYATDESSPGRLHGAMIGQITKDAHGTMYFATEGSGVNILRAGSDSFEHLTTANGLPANKIKALWYDPAYDRLFISVYMEGICYLDLQTQTVRRIESDVLSDVYQHIIENFAPCGDGLILHTQNGLFRLNRETLAIDWFFADAALRERCSGIIRTVFLDEKNILWVSSFRRGLFTIDLQTNQILRYYGDGISRDSGIPSAVIKIGGDYKRGLYLVTLKSGILKYDQAADTFYVFNEEKHNLPSNICYNVAFSPENHLIVTSNKGITLMNMAPRNAVYSSYHIRLNQSSPLTAFIGECGLYVSAAENRIYAGCLYGLFCFSGEGLVSAHPPYALYFSSLQVNNGESVPLKIDLLQSCQVVLPYDKNTVSLKFASSDYLASRTSSYEYRLEGLDDYWIATGHKTIVYNSLPPGVYQLTVRETGDTGKTARMTIVIKPPLWRTVPACLAYLLALTAVVALIIRAYRSRTLLEASLEMERREVIRIEELNKNKMDFFVNVSNEFRIPLTIIVSLIDRMPEFPAKGKNKLEKIKKQAVRLQDLVTEMLDFRKMEQNKLRLKIGKYDLMAFIQTIYSNFSDYASEKELFFKFNRQSDYAPVWFDQRQMQKVFYHLTSFIFKASAPRDAVTISVRSITGYWKVQIAHKAGSGNKKMGDDLIDGMNGADSFSDISMWPDGDVGIAFSKGILSLHKGSIAVSREGDTIVWIVSIPTGLAHLNMEDIQDRQEEAKPLLPFALADRTGDDDDGDWLPETEKKTYKMVLVEDDYEMRHLLKETFSMHYQVMEFDNADSGYDYILEEKPDIVICEINVPGLSGIEMCSRVKSNIYTRHIPVILVTSQPSEQQNITSIRSGAEYYVVKPFNIRILFLRCNYLIRNRRLILRQKPEQQEQMLEMATDEREKEFLAAANRIVEENGNNHSFDTKMWYEKLGMGRTRFFNRIKEITGMTPNDYLVYLKMNKGRQLLEQDAGFTIAEIAYQLGFNHPAYFSKCFKKQFGVTPQEYKRTK